MTGMQGGREYEWCRTEADRCHILYFFSQQLFLGFLGRLMWVMSTESVLWSVWISQEVIDIRYRSGVDGKNTMKKSGM
jgi:hypothetical protein